MPPFASKGIESTKLNAPGATASTLIATCPSKELISFSRGILFEILRPTLLIFTELRGK